MQGQLHISWIFKDAVLSATKALQKPKIYPLINQAPISRYYWW